MFGEPSGDATPLAFALLDIRDGTTIVRQEADGDGKVDLVGVAGANVDVRAAGASSWVSVPADGALAAVDLTAQFSELGNLMDHPKVREWCAPTEAVAAAIINAIGPAGMAVKVFLARRASTCTQVLLASRKGGILAAGASSDGVAWDGTPPNALKHAGWSMYAYVALKRLGNGVVDIRGGRHVIRNLYEYEQLKGGGQQTPRLRIRIRRFARMDQWNDDRGWDFTANRLNGNFSTKHQVLICQRLVRLARRAVGATYTPGHATWQPRPPYNKMIYNFRRTTPYNESDDPDPLIGIASDGESACNQSKRQILQDQPGGGVPGDCEPWEMWMGPEIGCLFIL